MLSAVCKRRRFEPTVLGRCFGRSPPGLGWGAGEINIGLGAVVVIDLAMLTTNLMWIFFNRALWLTRRRFEYSARRIFAFWPELRVFLSAFGAHEIDSASCPCSGAGPCTYAADWRNRTHTQCPPSLSSIERGARQRAQPATSLRICAAIDRFVP